jgi:hypothetical protein
MLRHLVLVLGNNRGGGFAHMAKFIEGRTARSLERRWDRLKDKPAPVHVCGLSAEWKRSLTSACELDAEKNAGLKSRVPIRPERARAGPSSQYRGVSWYKASGKWMARIIVDGKHRHLGYFAEEIEAAAAYREAAATIAQGGALPARPARAGHTAIARIEDCDASEVLEVSIGRFTSVRSFAGKTVCHTYSSPTRAQARGLLLAEQQTGAAVEGARTLLEQGAISSTRKRKVAAASVVLRASPAEVRVPQLSCRGVVWLHSGGHMCCPSLCAELDGTVAGASSILAGMPSAASAADRSDAVSCGRGSASSTGYVRWSGARPWHGSLPHGSLPRC